MRHLFTGFGGSRAREPRISCQHHPATSMLSVDNPPIGEKVAAASGFHEVLRRPDERHEVERGMEGAPHPPFSANGTAKRQEGDGPADPGHRPRHALDHPFLGVSAELTGSGCSHVALISKACSGRACRAGAGTSVAPRPPAHDRLAEPRRDLHDNGCACRRHRGATTPSIHRCRGGESRDRTRSYARAARLRTTERTCPGGRARPRRGRRSTLADRAAHYGRPQPENTDL